MSNQRHHAPRLRGLSADQSLTALFVMLVLLIFFISPFVGQLFIGWARELGFSLVLVFGVAAITEKHRWRLIAVAFAALLFVVKLTGALERTPTGKRVEAVITLVVLVAVAVLTLYLVFREGEVTRHRIEGAIAVYLLVALIWMRAYFIVATAIPNSFAMSEQLAATGDLAQALGYFSFCTLTTVGYGDITPVHPVARNLAAAEALIGQLYPAILIARLLSLRTIERKVRR